MKIDLDDIVRRESERVDWKENVGDLDDLLKTITAFANDFSNLGGGYIICGVKETTDEFGFKKLVYTGLTDKRLKEIEGKVLNDCHQKINPPIIPQTEELVIENKRIFVIIVPSTRNAHTYRSRSKNTSVYYIRSGSNTIEARNGLLRELLSMKQVMPPWDKRANFNSSIDDIDLLMLREYLKEVGLWNTEIKIDDYLSDKYKIAEFVPPLAEKEKFNETLFPKNFSLLLFTSSPIKYVDGCYSVFSIYHGEDKTDPLGKRLEITGSLVEQTKKVINLVEEQVYTLFDKESSSPNKLKYPIRALQEAIVNAFVHRDYEDVEISRQPIRITIFSDRIEIFSPGTLPRVVDENDFVNGLASPHWRNQTLAYFFTKLKLAQAEGQGIKTILREAQNGGYPKPEFKINKSGVKIIIYANERFKFIDGIAEVKNNLINNKIELARSKAEELLIVEPNNIEILTLYAKILDNSNEYEKLINVYSELLSINSNDTDTRMKLFHIFKNKLDYTNAENTLQELLRIDKNNLQAFIELGQLYLHQNKIDDAEKVFKNIHKIDNNNVYALAELIMLYDRLNEPEKCLEYFESFFNNINKSGIMNFQSIFNLIFNFCKKYDKHDKAQSYYNKYMNILNQDNKNLFNSLFS